MVAPAGCGGKGEESVDTKVARNRQEEVEMVERVTVSSGSSRGMREQVSTPQGQGLGYSPLPLRFKQWSFF